MHTLFKDYANRLVKVINTYDWEKLSPLANEFERCWSAGHQIFLCGNGGSAGNAIHLANDYIYGVAKQTGSGLKVHALTANPSVLTCLANDVGYDLIFSEQLAVFGEADDLLVCFSGSGNSKNIINAINQAKRMGIRSCAVLGFSGGKAKGLADISLHFPVNDMQIAEDLQLVVGHMLMQFLHSRRESHTY
jgi:D-sedoheptulose 7-phosphate isomerase